MKKNTIVLSSRYSSRIILRYLNLKHFNPLFLLAVLSLISLTSCASVSKYDDALIKSEKIYTPTQLREDLQFLTQSLGEIHPEPFARLALNSYQKKYQQLYEELSWPQRRNDFYRRIAPLVSSFADTHTRLRFPQQEYNRFLNRFGEFPLTLLNSTDGLIVVADQQRPTIVPVGAELLSINSVSVDTILDKFKRYVPFETESGQRRMIQLEFSRLLWSVYKFAENYQVEYLWQGKIVQAELQGFRRKSLGQLKQRDSHYGAVRINARTSLLWLNDFNEQHDVFEHFLSEQFQRMSGQKNAVLILDLRYNQGGITDNLSLLLSYLSQKPINWATSASLKMSAQFKRQNSILVEHTKHQKYGSYLDWLPVEYLSFWHWEMLFAGEGDVLWSKIGPVSSNSRSHFTGQIYVLSNGYCFSACAALIATLQQNKLAIVIGEPTGSLTHVQYGYPIEVELPNTGLKLIIPAIKFVHDDGNEHQNTAIIPDYRVERLKADVISGTDPVFDFALELSKMY